MRVVTYNIWNGGEDRVAAIEEVLRPQEADFVAVQEASNRANVELLARRLGMELAYGEANSEYAVAWLSLGPIARDENGWTYLSWHPWARLDHVFVGPTLSVERCEVVTDAGGASDHLPVVADVSGERPADSFVTKA